ncbi:concanavalin A-like lectin/glucanase [Cryphonectria parasitica EP155]|uniref:Concanavalin A-like lectin/glucanase n=1 Tax=Cryphonectria parasitica (strain ATCC 38755 / EP155) TaxID=660469 RepID=A0A9P5CPD9_CRYP1|nr:concanavalin A-like lectin/glucanase [Cryphonectria parasitica EP155]KAF3765066.1 concanavalin A-like lectin/glucanase [Cryphonectria parasitica EP155]
MHAPPYSSASKRDVSESLNWSGVELIGTKYTSVTGTIVVPTIDPSASNYTEGTQYGGAIWVGIDGDSCAALLQTGIFLTIEDGVVGYSAWACWLPDVDTLDVSISAGDSIQMTVTAIGTNSGIAVIDNLSTGVSANYSYTDIENDYGDLCGQTAEWIVEDYAIDVEYDLIPFIDYGSVEFTGCSAVTEDETVDMSGAAQVEILEMVSETTGAVVSNCTYAQDTVTCAYL